MYEDLLEHENNDLIRSIIQSEWNMFDQVQNIGGRAGCQDDFTTFFVMRFSQFAAWDRPVLESYLADHQTAAAEGANLVERKYAYIMMYTDPTYFANELARALPPLTDGQFAAVDEIMEVYTAWYRQAREKWPAFVSRGRPEAEGDDPEAATSVDAYLRGELFSYSPKTLQRFCAMVHARQAQGRSMVEEIYARTARFYGFSGLDEAEAALGGAAQP